MVTQCRKSAASTDARGPEYAGAAACMKCHQNIYTSFLNTAHHQSSAPASFHNIHGSFKPGENTFVFNGALKVKMESGSDGLYQVAYTNEKPTASQRFDITVGGVKAQTYLTWKDDQLFELPISYFNNLHSWTNSPGYSARVVNFDRPIIPRCLECHTSYISDKEQPNAGLLTIAAKFEKSSIIYGIDCERCHGPAAAHVEFQTAHPEEKQSKYIVSYKSLTRAQKLDACAVCHAGNKDDFQVSAFRFKMGDTLSKFKDPDFFARKMEPAAMDVHGNQSGLLAGSKCFLMSKMDCTTCHNTHSNDRGNITAYSQKCLSCHTTVNHTGFKSMEGWPAIFRNNCIDCHMPQMPSGAIKVETADGRMATPYLVRTHYIAVYPEESKKIMEFIKQKKLMQ